MAQVREFAFHGEYDISQRAAIEKEFKRLRKEGANATTILDLTEVDYVDLTFLNALIGFQKHALNEDADSRLCVAAGQNLSRMFQITALDRMFPVFASMASARDYVVSRKD